jgi:hypothetical protein
MLTLLAVTMAFPAPIFAQRGQDAGLVGTVRDSSGAVLSGATVTVSSPQLIGGPHSATTDSAGGYRLPFLPIGKYEILASFPGFVSARRSDVTLWSGLTFTVDFTLEIEGFSERVKVQTQPPLVDVQTSSSPVVIDRHLIDSLPLPRTPFSGAGTVADVVNLAPGVVQSVALGGTFLANPLSVDGTSGTEPGYGQPNVSPNPNWIDQIQVVSVGADAQYGEFTGARVNAITRSGSNHFSGLGDYWTTRPSWTGNNRAGLTPDLQQRFTPIEIIERWDSDLQIGGPIVKDRLWFFSGGETYRDAYWPVSFTGVPRGPESSSTDARQRKSIGKLTSTISPSVRAEGYVSHVSSYTNGANAAPNVTPDATAVDDRPETMWNARVLWTLGSRAFVELRQSGQDQSEYGGPPDSRRSGPPAHYDRLTDIYSGNASSFFNVNDRLMTSSAQVTYFAAAWHGGHQLQFGFEYEHASLQSTYGYIDGQLFWDRGGQPSEVQLFDGATNRPIQGRRALYAQDGWNITDRLTLNVGMRVGFYRGSVPGHDPAFVNRSVSPRLGLAFDLTGDHRTVLRAHYGRYSEAFVTSYYDFLDPLSQSPSITAKVVGPNQFVEEYRSPPVALASIDPNTEFPFAEEYLVGVEHQIPWGMSVRTQYVSKDFKNAIGFIDPARRWLPVQETDPGPDGVPGTSDDGGPITVYFDQNPTKSAPLLTNPPAYRRYHAVQFIATRPYSHGVQFQASYTWSRTVGNYNNAAFSNAANNDLGIGGVFMNPNGLINNDGRTRQDFTHDFKLLGTYRVGRWGGLNVSGVYKYQGGRPWARSAYFDLQTESGAIFVEPIGARELPSVKVLDLRVEKTWKVAPGAGTVSAFVDAFNITNQGVALRVTNSSGPNLGVPVQWLDPRTVRAGVRFLF